MSGPFVPAIAAAFNVQAYLGGILKIIADPSRYAVFLGRTDDWRG